jgi:hypothetical protein
VPLSLSIYRAHIMKNQLGSSANRAETCTSDLVASVIDWQEDLVWSIGTERPTSDMIISCQMRDPIILDGEAANR